MNITLLGNAIWGDNSYSSRSALELELDSGAKGWLSMLSTLLF